MDIPVYLIAGFLDAGKTSFINGVLRDGFAEEDRTLLICCEEGELEYDPRVLGNVFTYTVDDPAQLTPELFKKLEKQYRPKQVIIEYNGMWMMEPLYRDGLPANWILYQIHVPCRRDDVRRLSQEHGPAHDGEGAQRRSADLQPLQ